VGGTERLDELAGELDRLFEQLAEAAMDLLRSGIGEGTEAAAALATRRERLVNRARSSVEKAVTLLGQAAAAEGAPAAARPRRPAAAASDDVGWEAP
jgi:hypothetical protein